MTDDDLVDPLDAPGDNQNTSEDDVVDDSIEDVSAEPIDNLEIEIIDEIDEAHYQRELKQFKKYSPDKDPDPEEEEYWRHETKHSIS